MFNQILCNNIRYAYVTVSILFQISLHTSPTPRDVGIDCKIKFTLVIN
jgi:hypothetical protein